MFQEYPKGLFKDGDAQGDYRIVKNQEQETQARADDFLSIGESNEKPQEPKRRGRPPKAQE